MNISSKFCLAVATQFGAID